MMFEAIVRMVAFGTTAVLLWLVTVLFAAVPAWLLWNWLVPPLFGLPDTSLAQMVGLIVLSGLLIGSRAKISLDTRRD